jgi:hypothetical protein
MINFLEYINILAEADAPALGAPPAGGMPPPPPVGGAGAMPPAGGANDAAALSAPSSAPSPVPAASGGGGGAPPPMDAMGAAPAGDVSALKAPNINLEDAYDHLEDFFSKNKK